MFKKFFKPIAEEPEPNTAKKAKEEALLPAETPETPMLAQPKHVEPRDEVDQLTTALKSGCSVGRSRRNAFYVVRPDFDSVEFYRTLNG